MLLVGLNFALPIIRRGKKEGALFLLASAVLILACALAVILLKVTVIIVILGAIVLGSLFFSSRTDPTLLEQSEGNSHD